MLPCIFPYRLLKDIACNLNLKNYSNEFHNSETSHKPNMKKLLTCSTGASSSCRECCLNLSKVQAG